MTLEIRAPQTITEFRALEALQREVWETDGGLEPAETLLTVQKNGGVVLAAYETTDDVANATERPVGFVFGFLGRTAGGLKHCSHMLGVLESHRDKGVGYELKKAQREAVLAQYLTLITWTFDPLESRNAAFNLRKLGAACRLYLPNLYGKMGGINQGLPSDRFQVDWWVSSAHVRERLAGAASPEGADEMKVEALRGGDFVHPPDFAPPLESPRLLVEIPTDIQAVKRADKTLASAWRDYTRDLFSRAFAQGYTATDFSFKEGRGYYVLERDWTT